MRIPIVAAVAALVLAGLSGVAPAAGADPVAPNPDALTVPSVFHPLSSARLFDTRNGLFARAPKAGETVHVQIPGVSLVPADATAVALTVTVTAPRAAGFVTISKHGTVRPATSDITFARGQTVTNTVAVPIGVHGWVDMYNGAPDVIDLVTDVIGYWAAAPSDGAGHLVSLTPTRVVDTRAAGQPPALASRTSAAFLVAGVAGVPLTGVRAVVAQVTTTRASRPGFVTAWASGTPRPNYGTDVFSTIRTTTTLATVPIGADGRIAVYNGSSAAVDVLVDVIGYLTGGTPDATGSIVTVAPSTPVVVTRGGVAPKGVVSISTSGRNGVPSTGVSGLVIAVAATRETSSGYASVYPAGEDRHISTALVWTPGETRSNLFFVPTGPGGVVRIYNGSAGRADFVVNVVGYVAA